MKAGRSEYYYTKDVLGYLASKRRGRIRTQRDAPFQPLAWPLKVGRQWNNVFLFERVNEGTSFDIDYRIVLSKLEEVTVPAGKFKAFKIEVYRTYDRELLYEYWYSPKVKWYVKRIAYVGRGTRPREARLKSFNVAVASIDIHYLKKEPPPRTIRYGEIVYVDEGTCPNGEVKEVTGGSNKRGIPRKRRCVKRPQ